MRFLVLFFFCSIFSFLHAEADLMLSDVHKVMNKLFEEHVSEREMNSKVMQRTIEHFISQFDPKHVYLLESEVHPYLELSQARLDALCRDYEKGDYVYFKNMITIFQEAIRRARGYRNQLHLTGYGEVTQRAKEERGKIGNEATFAKSEIELQARQDLFVVDLIYQRKSHGVSFEESYKDVLFEISENENRYVFQDAQGRGLSKEEKEHLLAFYLLDAMTSSLDAHSTFLSEKETHMMRQNLQKGFQGIGVMLDDQAGHFIIRKIVPASPADKSGILKEGDEIVAIDDQKIIEWPIEKVVEHLQGTPKSRVKIAIKRIREPIVLERASVSVQEGRVTEQYVKTKQGAIGVITLPSFYRGQNGVSSVEDMKKAIAKLQSEGALDGVLLDMRENRGGYLMEAVGVVGLFIKTGVVAIAKTGKGELGYFRDLDPLVVYSGPLVILTSKKTASAAEIVTQSLKDYGKAIVVGDEQTFGKGSIQAQTATGSESAIASDKKHRISFKVTVGRYYSVSGYSLQLEGVKADIVVPGFYFYERLGERYLNEVLSHDQVESQFADSLQDLSLPIKELYKNNYLPYLEKPIAKYRRWVAELKMRSGERMQYNQEYARFLKGEFNSSDVHINEETGRLELTENERKKISQMQLEEAEKVLFDLIQLQKTMGQ